MFRQISFLLLICFASLSVSAQAEKYTAPVKWEKYKVGDKEVAVLLPKLPILIENSDVCREQETKQYAAYAEGTVYGFEITSKIKGKLPFLCSPQKKFDKQNFQDRITELKTRFKEFTETIFKQDNLTVNKISAKNSVYWLINDFESYRWFELWITGRNDEKPEVTNFIKSIEIGKTTQGIEIGKGADRIFGDEIVKTNVAKSGEETPVTIVLKPFPRYTDAARQARVQGTVSLKISFSENGGISNIEIVKALPNGLTEQAYAVAKKIVFIPATKDGMPYSTTKTVEYTFSIY